jgi:hypothetical protein
MSIKPIRVRLSRARGWRLPENTISVARPSPWGNPFIASPGETALVVDLFRQGMLDPNALIMTREMKVRFFWMRDNLQTLRGKNLACWCHIWQCLKCLRFSDVDKPIRLTPYCFCSSHPKLMHSAPCLMHRVPCHADVLLELAN